VRGAVQPTMFDSRALSSSVWKRKAVHAGMGLFALALRWLDWRAAALLALTALLFNLFAMPRIGRGIYRDASKRRDVGIVAYAAVVLALILLFRHHLAWAAAIWGMLAFGDPAAEIAGRLLGGPRLPWNRKKTWAGFFAYAIAALVAASFLLGFVGGAPVPFLLVAGLALLAAFLESVESGLDDNLVPALPVALVSAFLLLVPPSPANLFQVDWRLAVLLNLGVAVAMALLGAVSFSGAVAGAVAGSLILAFGGWGAYAVLWTFFLAATIASKLGLTEKERRGTAQASRGRRGARHVVANCFIGVLLALVAMPWAGGASALAFAGCFAAALADTLGTEVGSLYGNRAFSPTLGTALPVGTPGAISWPGTLAGLAGAILVGLVAAATGSIPFSLLWVVAVAGLLGSLAESVVNDLGRLRGLRLDHEFANAFNTFVGAIVALEIALSLEKGGLYLPIER